MATSKHGVELASPAAMVTVYSATVVASATIWSSAGWLLAAVIR